MLSAVAPIWTANETWLVVTAVICGSFSGRLCDVAVGVLSPLIVMLLGLILRGVGSSFATDAADAVDLGCDALPADR